MYLRHVCQHFRVLFRGTGREKTDTARCMSGGVRTLPAIDRDVQKLAAIIMILETQRSMESPQITIGRRKIPRWFIMALTYGLSILSLVWALHGYDFSQIKP